MLAAWPKQKAEKRIPKRRFISVAQTAHAEASGEDDSEERFHAISIGVTG